MHAMKLHILSDLHNEFDCFDPPEIEADVVVLAGDINLHTRGIEWAIENWKDSKTAILYVIGNHEFYHAELHGIRQQIRKRAEVARSRGAAIWVLDDESVELNDPAVGKPVRFLGATLWTDYKLFGDDAMAFAMKHAERELNDHRIIRCSPQDRFPAAEAARLNRESVSWLAAELAMPYAGKSVVITHHLPSGLSVAPRFKAEPLSAAFASHLDHLVEKADLWIHGHTHDNFDYWLGRCRVVCNPRGYISARGIENPSFIPDLVVEI
jgi:predicted phosphodiesterase